MRYSVGLPGRPRRRFPDEFVTGDAIAEMAAAVEAAGLDAVFVTDHPAPDDRWLEGGGHHAQEPLVALAFAAAATRRIVAAHPRVRRRVPQPVPRREGRGHARTTSRAVG